MLQVIQTTISLLTLSLHTGRNFHENIFYLAYYSNYFQLFHPLLLNCPQIFHIIYCMLQVIETTISLLMLSLPTEERVNDECLHATELFVIVQCTCPDIIFHFCVAHSLWQDTSIRLMCKVLFCRKKFFFRENKQETQFVVIRVSINVLPLLCP